MKKRLAAFAFAALAAFGARAVGTEGDIRSIEAVDVIYDDSHGYYYANDLTPHTVGESFYILVRLLNEDFADTTAVHTWQIGLSAAGTAAGETVANVLYHPGLRIAIGSEMVTASYVTEGPNGEASGPNPQFPRYYTDFYFKYTVKEGQLGLPVRLVNTKNEIISASTTGSYSLQFVNVNTAGAFVDKYWELSNNKGTLANFWFGPQVPDPEPSHYPGEPEKTQHLFMEYVWPGIYVQTIDFEPSYADETDPSAKVWREVYQGLDDSVGKVPAIVGTADDEGTPTTVYIWSEDESVFTISGIQGHEVSYKVRR